MANNFIQSAARYVGSHSFHIRLSELVEIHKIYYYATQFWCLTHMQIKKQVKKKKNPRFLVI